MMAGGAKHLNLDSVTVDLSNFLACCGKDVPQPEQHNYEVSRDSIRHICYSIEEYNGLYLDEEFARQTRWGGIIAPPGYLYSHGRQYFSWVASLGAFVDSEGREFDMGDNAGGDWEFYLPARPGDTIISHATPLDAHVRRGRRAGIVVVVYGEVRFVNQRGELVAKLRESTFRFSSEIQRQIGGYAASYPPLPTGQITRDPGGPWNRFHFPDDRPYPAHIFGQGALAPGPIPRRRDNYNVYFEDVQEDMEIPELVVGPLSMAHTRRFEIHTIDFWRPETGGRLTVRDGGPVPDNYAPGVMRVAWFGSMLTRWAGPNAWVQKLSYQNREWVLVGFKYFCRGKVVKKYVEGGRAYIECRLRIDNELGVTTNQGYAVVELPSRGQDARGATRPC